MRGGGRDERGEGLVAGVGLRKGGGKGGCRGQVDHS